MTPALIIIIVVFLVAIILIGIKPSGNKKTREEFLKELCKFVEGRMETIKEHEDSYKILFTFRDQDFIYEDITFKGFRGAYCKAFLKSQSGSQLNLIFSEKKTSRFISPDIQKNNPNEKPVRLPKKLSELSAVTNNTEEAEKLFEDAKTASIFTKFKEIDNRGMPHMSLNIFKGQVTLMFGSTQNVKPSLIALYKDISQIEGYCEDIVNLVKKLNAAG